MYFTIKAIHLYCALFSLLGFLLRAYLHAIDSNWLRRRLILVTPHIVDTLFLGSGFTLAFMLNMGLFAQGWLTMKIALLPLYLLFAGLALNRGTAPIARIAAFFLAVFTFAYIVGIALNKTAASWFALLN